MSVPRGSRPVAWLNCSCGRLFFTVVGVGADVDTTASSTGSMVVVGTTSVGTELLGTIEVLTPSTSAEVVSGEDDSETTVSLPPQALSAIRMPQTGNQRLSLWLRRITAGLIPLKPMSRRVWLVGSLLMGVVVGCGNATEPTASDAQFVLSQDYPLPSVKPEEPILPTSVTGADNIVVQVTDTSRIIVLNEAIAEIVVSLGLQKSIIGRDATTTLASLADVAEVSSGHDISAESVLSLRPSVVIGDTRTGPAEAIEQLRSAGVPVVIAPEVWSLSALPERVTLIAQALGIPGAGQQLIALSETSIDDALRSVGAYASAPRVAFLYVRGTASVYLLGGSGSGADELLAAAGAIDVGAYNGLSAFTPLTAEAIVQADPDVLLVMTRGLDSVGGIDGLLALPGVSSTRAATARAVIAVDDDLLLSFGPRTGALIARLAELLSVYDSDT